MNQDLLDQFLDFYEQENEMQAIRLILPSPSIAYETLYSKDKVFFYFINFVDAMIFKGALEFKTTFLVLESLCQEYPALKFLGDRFLEIIRFEYDLFNFFLNPNEEDKCPSNLKQFFELIRQGILNHEDQIRHLLQGFPLSIQNLFNKKLSVRKGWEKLQKSKEHFTKSLGEDLILYKQPWRCFSYSLSLDWTPKEVSGVPLIFLEPVEGFDYVSFLEFYCSQPCLIVFPTLAHLFQMLQFEEIHSIIQRQNVYVYVLEVYPHQQFLSQQFFGKQKWDFEPVWMIKNLQIEPFLSPFQEALKKCLNQSEEVLSQDSLTGNWLYALGKKIIFNLESHRYGFSRAVSLSIEQGMQRWYDPHKGALPEEASLGPAIQNSFLEEIKKQTSQRKARDFAPDQKIKLVHIVPQIVDGGHAPTNLLTNLCSFFDPKWFDVGVYSTERLTERLLSYPVISYLSNSSEIRGCLTTHYFKQMGVHVSIDQESPTFDATVKNVLQFLEAQSVDIAVFHGPDELNSLISSATTVPIRVFFDHGTLPSYPCFDLAILSTEEALLQNQEKFRQQGMESCVLPFSINVRQKWKEEPFSKTELGLPEDCFVLTTISHHLDTRVTNEMLHAIAKILKRCPTAVYAPIGEVNDQDKWKAIFDQYGVKDKLFILGHRSNPSQYARSMHLYLNEFPFGSGLAILDAMAAGCPVVSMYEENGPQQARYAATYFGLDYVIKSGKVEDYIELACQLIEDPSFYQEWSKHALSEYEKRFNVQDYVRKFEIILEQFIEYSFSNSK